MIFLYVPSKDEIQERRADMALLKNTRYKLEKVMVKRWSELCARTAIHLSQITSKKKTYDWCQIDPKNTK